MNKKTLQLDFNKSDLKFSLCDLAHYDMDAIYDNMDKFRKFAYSSTLYDSFDKVYNTQIFQITLLDSTTNTIDNLVQIYNTIAQCVDFIREKQPVINRKQLIQQLRLRGYTMKRTSRKNETGVYKQVLVAKRNEEEIWNI